MSHSVPLKNFNSVFFRPRNRVPIGAVLARLLLGLLAAWIPAQRALGA